MAENQTVRRVKTDAESLADRAKQTVEFSNEKNVLNSYRSFTYNFTLAGLRKSLVDKPEELRANTELDLVILRSGGKGTAGISTKVEGVERKSTSAEGDTVGSYVDTSGSNLVDGFNKFSPGRFDMFIDNVEMKTLMAFSEVGNVTLPTAIKFEVIEPYSVNGFIEALHVAAVAAGYSSYLQASFVLKIDFVGYHESESFPVPEQIPNSQRFFPFVLTGVEVDITERGTRYVCSAVPVEQRVMGASNVLKKQLSGNGVKVKEILKDLLNNFTESLKNSDDKSKVNPGPGDTYQIKFPQWDPINGFDYNKENAIADADFAEPNKDSALYKLNDPDQSQIKNDSVKRITTSKSDKGFQVQFAEGVTLSEAIIAVVRDSLYVREIISKIERGDKIIDAYGFLDYFSLRTEVKNLDILNQTTGKPYQEITYVISPYRVHYTKIPRLGNLLLNEAEIKRQSLREYNYIYTGLNVDILNFKLSFNTLYFEAVPADLGNVDQGVLKNTAARPATPKIEIDTKDQSTAESARLGRLGSVPAQATNYSSDLTSTKAGGSVTAGQPLSEYAAMAKAIHNSVIDSKASMITGEIEILGDPFYLVTGGMGSYNPKPIPNKNGPVGLGEAPYTQKEVLININFRNPIDINKLNQGGLYNFDKNRVPFSGVYQVTEATSTFKNGDFRQRLNIIRVPGQVIDMEVRSEDPASAFAQSENAEINPIVDASRAVVPEQRMSETAALSNIDRGVPFNGLPGQLSNYTAASGGLGGSSTPLLNQTPGFAANPLAAGSAAIGQILGSDFTSNVRLSLSGLASIAQNNLGTAAVINAAAGVITGSLPAQRVAATIASSIATAALTPVLSRSTDSTQGNLSNPEALVQNIGTSAIDAVSGLGSQASELVSDVGNKVSSLLGTVSDPSAIAARVGIDAAKISGLSSGLQSKVTQQLTNLTKNIPGDVNLNQALDYGMALDYITPETIKNIPATPPKLTAPAVEVNQAYLSEVLARGGTSAVEDLYGVTDITQLSSSVAPQNLLSNAVDNNSGDRINRVASTIVRDKINTVESQLSNLTGQIKVSDRDVSGSVSAVYGSVTKQSPLTKLINNLVKK